MEIYDRKQVLIRELWALETEADVLMGFVSEELTISVYPFWECSMTETQLFERCIKIAAKIADQLSEGDVIGVVVDKRGKS